MSLVEKFTPMADILQKIHLVNDMSGPGSPEWGVSHRSTFISLLLTFYYYQVLHLNYSSFKKRDEAPEVETGRRSRSAGRRRRRSGPDRTAATSRRRDGDKRKARRGQHG